MPHFNRTLGQYRTAVESRALPHAFPQAEAAMRAAYPPERGYTVRAFKGRKDWCIFVHKGLTTGFRIDFMSVAPAFGPPSSPYAAN